MTPFDELISQLTTARVMTAAGQHERADQLLMVVERNLHTLRNNLYWESRKSGEVKPPGGDK